MLQKILLICCSVFLVQSLSACLREEGQNFKRNDISVQLVPHPEQWNVLVHSYIQQVYYVDQQETASELATASATAELVCPYELRKSGD